MNGSALLVVTRLTLREAARRRLLLAVLTVTIVLVLTSAWGFQRLTALPCAEAGSQCTIVRKGLAGILVTLITFMYSFVFSVGAVFIVAPLVAGEIESGVALAMLTRPISRAEWLLGKWLGAALVVLAYAAVTTGLEFIAVDWLVGYVPPHPYTATAFLLGESAVMLTLAMLFSTRLAPMTAGIVALVLFGMAWLGGIANSIGTVLGSTTVRNVGLASRFVMPTDGLWRGALYNIEPSIIIDATADGRRPVENPFFVLGPPAVGLIAWACVWLLCILVLAVFSLSRREI